MMIVALQLNSMTGDMLGNASALMDAVGEAIVQYDADICVTSAGYLNGLPTSCLDGMQGHEESMMAVLEMLAERLHLAPAVLVGGTCSIGFAPFFEEAVYLIYGGQVHRVCTYTEGYGLILIDGQNVIVTLRDGLERAIAKGFQSPPQALVHLDAQPFVRNAVYAKETHLRVYANIITCPCISVNPIGYAGGRVYHGNSFVVDDLGQLIGRAPLFERALLPLQCTPVGKQGVESLCVPRHETSMGLFWDALVFGLRDMIRKSACSKVVLGLSGGMDSALVAALAVSALGKDNVQALIMPSPWSSQGSLDDALALASELDIVTHILPISSLMDGVDEALQPCFAGRERDVTEENIQARLRGLMLMAFANKFGMLVLATGNKSELAVGYCTLYGDMVGALAPIGDVYKTEVYSLAAWYNGLMKRQIVPQNIFEKAPSAELRPDQKDQDVLPPYEVLDAILQALLEGNTAPEHIRLPDVSQTIIEDVVRRFMDYAFKHTEAASCIQVSHCALAREARLPAPLYYRIANCEVLPF